MSTFAECGSWLVGWLVGCLVGWLAIWLVGWFGLLGRLENAMRTLTECGSWLLIIIKNKKQNKKPSNITCVKRF